MFPTDIFQWIIFMISLFGSAAVQPLQICFDPEVCQG